MEEKFVGALLGTFVGDTLGMPVEGLRLSRIEKDLGEVNSLMEARLGKGAYTDDTQMMIGLAESLMAHPEFIVTACLSICLTIKGFFRGNEMSQCGCGNNLECVSCNKWNSSGHKQLPEGRGGAFGQVKPES